MTVDPTNIGIFVMFTSQPNMPTHAPIFLELTAIVFSFFFILVLLITSVELFCYLQGRSHQNLSGQVGIKGLNFWFNYTIFLLVLCEAQSAC